MPDTRPNVYLLRELERRLAKLDCLALPTKRSVLWLAEWAVAPESLQTYLTQTIPFLDREFASVSHRRFRALCARLARVPDLPTLLAMMGVNADYQRLWMSLWARYEALFGHGQDAWSEVDPIG